MKYVLLLLMLTIAQNSFAQMTKTDTTAGGQPQPGYLRITRRTDTVPAILVICDTGRRYTLGYIVAFDSLTLKMQPVQVTKDTAWLDDYNQLVYWMKGYVVYGGKDFAVLDFNKHLLDKNLQLVSWFRRKDNF